MKGDSPPTIEVRSDANWCEEHGMAGAAGAAGAEGAAGTGSIDGVATPE